MIFVLMLAGLILIALNVAWNMALKRIRAREVDSFGVRLILKSLLALELLPLYSIMGEARAISWFVLSRHSTE